MSVALLHKVRSSLSYPLAASVRGGGRVWHAPVPTRYRFAIQSADSKGWLFKHNPELDANWTASVWAWAWVPITTASTVQGAGGTKPNGPGVADAMWRALLDIRRFAERMEKHLSSLEKHTSSLEKLPELVKVIRPPSSTWKNSNTVLIGTAVSILFYFSYNWLAQTVTVEVIDQFCVERLNNIAADPETQETIKKLLVMLVEIVKSRFNPLEQVKGIFSTAVDERNYGELVDMDTVLCLQILLVIQIVHGPTSDAIVQKLNIVGMGDPTRVREMLNFLEEAKYVEVMDTPKKIKTYWPSKAALNDSTSGELESKVKALVKTKVKAALKANMKVPEGDNK